MRALELQEAVFARLKAWPALTSITSERVYDHAPQDAGFPYVVIGDDVAIPFDVDDSLDSDHVATIHTWSQYRGLDETKRMQQAIYSALHRNALTVANAVYTDCTIEYQETFLDPDGLTRHGVQRFRFLIDEVTP